MKYDNPLRGGSRGGNQARNFRNKHGFLFAEANTEDIKFVTRAGVRRGLTPAQARGAMLGHLKTINERLSVELAELVAAKLEESRVPSRKGVSSGRLRQVILDPENRRATPYVMGVGKPAFMDNSAAKYWRSIEVGTHKFVGNPIKPGWLWGDQLTGAYGGRSRYGRYPLAGGRFTVSGGGNRTGRIRPMGPSYAYRALVDQGFDRRRAYLATRKGAADVLIKRPIAAHFMFRNAWREFDGRARGRAALRAALHDLGFLGPQ